MDQLESMRAFVKVVDAGGFAAAARALGLSRSVVNRAVIGLEQRLGSQLLRRSTRKVSPTESGQIFYDRCRPILEQVEDAVGAISALKEAPSGTLRVNAPMSFGTLRLSAITAAFMARYPDVRLEVALNDRRVDPTAEGFDISLRIGEPVPSTSLLSRDLGPVQRVLCGAPAYLASAGAPASPTDLRMHRCLHYGYLESGSQWRFRDPRGADLHVAVNCAMWSNNGEVLRDAAIAGQGLVLSPTFIVGEAIRSGALQVLLPDFDTAPATLEALYPRHRHQVATVRLFVDFVSAALQDENSDSA